jgi:hypothetical protein
VYLELGLGARMAALYDKEVETARGPLALRMMYDTAERFDRLDRRADARTGTCRWPPSIRPTSASSRS